MKLRLVSCLLALIAAPTVHAIDDMCELSRWPAGDGDLTCRLDVSAPAGGGGTSPVLQRSKTLSGITAFRFQVCSDWNVLDTHRDRSMTFAEIDFRAPDKPQSKSLLVFSAERSSGVDYLAIDWIGPTTNEATAVDTVPYTLPLALPPIAPCAPVLTDPYRNIGTLVTVSMVSRNEIEVRVGAQAPVKLKARLGSSLQVSPTQVRIAPLIYDHSDSSVIRTLWFNR